MWAGLIAGLGVAAVLLCGRVARSSRPERLRALAAGQDGSVTSGP
jgi:hypothetical protein